MYNNSLNISIGPGGILMFYLPASIYYERMFQGKLFGPKISSITDVGFGLERLEAIVNGTEVKSANETLEDTILKIVDSGYKPGPQKQGYVLRKLLRILYNNS